MIQAILMRVIMITMSVIWVVVMASAWMVSRYGDEPGSTCLHMIISVTQTCNEEGMEFTIRTPEGFLGRIYTYGYYDRYVYCSNGVLDCIMSF